MKKLALLLSVLLSVVSWSQAQDSLLVAAEYYLDTDPGIGNGIPISISSAASLSNVNFEMATDTVSPGAHTLFIRVQDEHSKWSVMYQKSFYLDQFDRVDGIIDSLEYFIDLDQGAGLGNPVDVVQSANLLLGTFSQVNLTPGIHTLYARAQVAGLWGITSSRSFWVDSLIEGEKLSEIEYVIDADPGVGQGEVLDIEDTLQTTQLFPIASAPLSSGFHTLSLRTRSANGYWSMPVIKPIFIDSFTLIEPRLVSAEVFFDSDKGIGQGQIIPLEDSVYSALDLPIQAFTDTLSGGIHRVFVRVMNERNLWSEVAQDSIDILVEGRAVDSIALVKLYQTTNGPNWTRQSNWLATPLDLWEGVVVSNNRVDSIKLGNNGLFGSLPIEIAAWDSLSYLDLSSNMILDSIPSAILALDLVKTIRVEGNEISYIPDVSSLPNLSSLSLDSNKLEFGYLEPLISIPNFTYTGQRVATDSLQTLSVKKGRAISLSRLVSGFNNEYQWKKDDLEISGAADSIYTISSMSEADTGTYSLVVSNTVLPGLTLEYTPFRLILEPSNEADSLALVSFYNEQGGSSWINNSGWLQLPLDQWYGVTLQGIRVTELRLPSNNLSGVISTSLASLDSLEVLDISSNKLIESVPNGLSELTKLSSISLSNNDLKTIPDFSGTITLHLKVEGNRLQFADLEANTDVANFTYSPQDSVSGKTNLLLDIGDPLEIGVSVSGSQNQYLWKKDGDILTDNNDTLTISSVSFEDAGEYIAEIRNDFLPLLTIYSGIIDVNITSLASDSLALLDLYQATNGENWTTTVNWTSAPISQWQQVTIENSRVTGLSLSGFGLTGSIPHSFSTITGLTTVDLSNNELISIPSIEPFDVLSSFDVRNNRLSLTTLETISRKNQVQFDPQKKLTISALQIKQKEGSTAIVSVEDQGETALYTWTKDGIQLEVASSPELLLDLLSYEDLGNYQCLVSSDILAETVPTFSLLSEPSQVIVTAQLSGLIKGTSGTLLAEGEIIAYEIVEGQSAYVARDTLAVINGEFLFEELVLGDYVLFTRSEDTVYLPTYYEETEDWVTADVISLRRDSILSGYQMIFKPEPLGPDDGKATIGMTVESDFDEDDASGRLEARRAVQKAGCSLRRRVTGGGRPEEDVFELIAYKETDAQGNVNFGFLPVGTYRLNIQYPGIPMDPTSFVQFTIEEGKEETSLKLEAVVTEEGIVVTLIEELAIVRNYFQNLQVYPVPTQEYLTLTYDRLLDETVVVHVLDMQGKKWLTEKVKRAKGGKLELDLKIIPAGTYLLHFEDAEEGKHLLTYRIVKY